MKRRCAASIMIVIFVVGAIPSMLDVRGQIQAAPTEEILKLAASAEQQVKNLTDLIYSNETVLQEIENFGLLGQLEGNMSTYNEGVENLTQAQTALAVEDYARASVLAIDAMRYFREVFRSIHVILQTAGIQKETLDPQGLLEGVSRALERIGELRAILPADAANALGLLSQAETYLDKKTAEELILEGKMSQVISNLSQANQLISEVYPYLKQLAEESNNWRLSSYCNGIIEKAMQSFSYGSQQGINATDYLGPLGYTSESQFVGILQNMTQSAQGKTGDMQGAMKDLEEASQMVRSMDQALTQEIIRRRGGSSGGGSGMGSGSGYGYGGN